MVYYRYVVNNFVRYILPPTESRNLAYLEDCQSNAFHIKHAIICAYKSKQNSRKYTFIQNKREINSRKYKIQEKLDLGCIRNRLERSHNDFKMEMKLICQHQLSYHSETI